MVLGGWPGFDDEVVFAELVDCFLYGASAGSCFCCEVLGGHPELVVVLVGYGVCDCEVDGEGCSVVWGVPVDVADGFCAHCFLLVLPPMSASCNIAAE